MTNQVMKVLHRVPWQGRNSAVMVGNLSHNVSYISFHKPLEAVKFEVQYGAYGPLCIGIYPYGPSLSIQPLCEDVPPVWCIYKTSVRGNCKITTSETIDFIYSTERWYGPFWRDIVVWLSWILVGLSFTSTACMMFFVHYQDTWTRTYGSYMTVRVTTTMYWLCMLLGK